MDEYINDRIPKIDEFRNKVNELAPELYTFYQESSHPEPEDFNRLIDDLRREVKRSHGIHSLYLDSSAYTNGVGKIRLIFVIDEALDKVKRWDTIDKITRTVGTRHILADDYYVFTPKLFGALQKFDSSIAPEYLCGEEIKITPVEDDEIRYFYIGSILDYLSRGQFLDFLTMEVERKIQSDNALHLLLELAHLLPMVKKILRRNPDEKWDNFAFRVKNLAGKWHNSGIEKYKELMWVVRAGFYIWFEVLVDLKAYFQEARIINLELADRDESCRAFLGTNTETAMFITGWNPVDSMQKMLNLLVNQKERVAILPVVFGIQLYEYSKNQNIFGKYIKSCFQCEGLGGNMERSYISWERARLLNDYMDVCKILDLKNARDLVFGCNLHMDTKLNKAFNFLSTRRNKAKTKKLSKLFRDLSVA